MAKATYLTFRGKTQRLADWSRETGIGSRTIKDRLRRGWTIEKALTDKDKVGVNTKENIARYKKLLKEVEERQKHCPDYLVGTRPKQFAEGCKWPDCEHCIHPDCMSY